MNDMWTIADDGTIESRISGRIGTLKHCEGKSRELIRLAPEMRDLLRSLCADLETAAQFVPDKTEMSSMYGLVHAARAVLAKVEG